MKNRNVTKHFGPMIFPFLLRHILLPYPQMPWRDLPVHLAKCHVPGSQCVAGRQNHQEIEDREHFAQSRHGNVPIRNYVSGRPPVLSVPPAGGKRVPSIVPETAPENK